jgi:Tfp pilus assembly protein PilP
MPAVPPLRLADAIEISGVVEVGGKTSVIVQVPNERTSRYVYVGDYVSNGNVLVKRVEMGIEPVVVLEEDGAEVTRYVGNGSSLTGLL